jgi:NAD(P)H-hydrate epimerase
VRLALPDVCLDVVAGIEPSYMTLPLPSDPSGRIALGAWPKVRQATSAATAIACGPGLGRSLGLDVLVSRLYAQAPQLVVVDADGLNALAARRDVLAEPGGPRVLTPHPGEFERLVGKGRLSADERLEEAAALAAKCGAVVVLKGHRTLVTDGRQHWVNATGNPGMATGGSGDVLTGLIVALACQGLSPWDAARLGVHLHGSAGDLAAAELGEEPLVASDLVRYLPEAFRAYRNNSRGPGLSKT